MYTLPVAEPFDSSLLLLITVPLVPSSNQWMRTHRGGYQEAVIGCPYVLILLPLLILLGLYLLPFLAVLCSVPSNRKYACWSEEPTGMGPISSTVEIQLILQTMGRMKRQSLSQLLLAGGEEKSALDALMGTVEYENRKKYRYGIYLLYSANPY
jgi:hypothetical protein